MDLDLLITKKTKFQNQKFKEFHRKSFINSLKSYQIYPLPKTRAQDQSEKYPAILNI